MNELDQLKEIVFKGGFDEESKKDVLQLEKELHEIAVTEKISQYSTIQKYLAYLQAQADVCTVELVSNRKLTDLERQTLFEKRDLCEQFLFLFGEKKKALEEKIKHYLDVAKTQSNVQ